MTNIGEKILQILNKVESDNIKQERELRKRLAKYVEILLEKDFQKLIEILYRVDVDENKLKQSLNIMSNDSPQDIIVNLIWERWKQKIIMKNSFKPNVNDISEEEKW